MRIAFGGFLLRPSGGTVPKATIRYPPSKQQLMGAQEGRLRRMSSHDRERRVQDSNRHSIAGFACSFGPRSAS